MDLVLIIGVGVVLLLVLLVVARRRDAEDPVSNGDMPDSSEFLVRLPPCSLLGRCLAPEDVEFVSRLRSRRVMRLLIRERRRLAVEWLHRNRREAGRLFRLHVRRSRHAPNLRPAAEFRLLVQTGLFLALCQLLAAIVRLYGPLRAQAFVSSVSALAGVLSNLGGRIAATVAPASVPDAPAAARS